MTIVFIGGGNMAQALIGGLVSSGRASNELHVVDPSDSARERCTQAFRVTASVGLDDDLPDSAICVLAVKPQLIQRVCETNAARLKRALVLSVAAGTPMQRLAQWLGGHERLARAMPNTPALIGLGVTGLVAAAAVDQADRARIDAILRAVGETVWFDEEPALDAVTAISGSGPAYVFRWIEAMQTAAAQLGLAPDKALTLIMHTVRGAAELALRSDQPVATLRANVTSPNGTTAAGLAAMEAAHIEQAIVDGVRAAHARSIELGNAP